VKKMLVAYASKYGATAEIAKAVAAALVVDGFDVDIRPAAEVSRLDGYDAVVVGSGVYVGRWHEDGTAFLRRFRKELASRPTWLFSSGPAGGSSAGDEQVAQARKSPETYPMPADVAKRAAVIGARGHATFPGKTGPYQSRFFGRWIPSGDWRDFDAIAAWAHRIVPALEPVAVPAS
jgi:menaquinone-dependent protoporphyrinogen oxidase